ncbi:MAG: LysR family transcriptional regulator [Bacteroidota bacterium]
MQYILALSETKHFLRASEQCFVTQPTLSMQLKKAEDTLGYFVFDRSRQPLELTPFGEQLIPILREIVAESEKIKLLTDQMKEGYRERVTIGIIPTIASYMVPDLFDKWTKKLEHIQLSIKEMTTEELIQAMERKEMDLIILAGPYHNHQYRTSHLFVEEILAYAPSYGDNKMTTEDLKQLRPWLLSQGNCLRDQMIRFCELSDDIEGPAFSYEGGNTDLLIKMVQKNGGYTLIPENHPMSDNQRAQLKRINAPGFKQYPAREIIAVSPQKSLKWSSIEKIVREVQLQYAKKTEDSFEILSWK